MREPTGCPGTLPIHFPGSAVDSLARPELVSLPRGFQIEYSTSPPATSGPDNCWIATWYDARTSIVSAWRCATNAATAAGFEAEFCPALATALMPGLKPVVQATIAND